MTDYEEVLQAYADALNATGDLYARVEVEGSAKYAGDGKSMARVMPGTIVEEDVNIDCIKERFEVRIELFVAGPEPRTKFFALLNEMTAQVRSGERLANAIAGFGMRIVDEPQYGDFDGFSAFVTIRQQVMLITFF